MSSPTIPFRVVFEDKNLLVLDKPAGLLSQGDISGDENLVDVLRLYFGRHYVGLVHRLDRNTSGLMVVAKRSKAADRLTEQLKSGELVRKYNALLNGHLGEAARWEHHLTKDETKNTVRVTTSATAGSKRAVLQVVPLKRSSPPAPALTWARFELETGRSHQIRAQAAFMGHSLVGDTKYNSGKGLSFERPALHSAWLSFEHPIGKTKLEFEAPPPRDISEVLKKYGF